MAPLKGRNSFLQVVAGELQGREFGDGDVHRAIVTGRNASSLIRPLSRRVDGIAAPPADPARIRETDPQSPK
jgi:hypothetical protein